MQGKHFEEFNVGDEYVTAARTITEADLAIYTGLSGDYNPLHTDEEFCRRTVFGTRIIQGPLGLAIAMGLSSRLGLTDGTTIAFLSIEEWKFKGPIKIGDTLRVKLRIADKKPSSKPGRGILKRHFQLLNQKGEIVQEGTTVALIATRPE